MQANRCDNLERASRAFSGKTPEQMQEQYGFSGKTCQHVLEGYRQDRAEWQASWDLLVKVIPEIGYPHA